jgi:peptidoglycan/LPS O-acetylase OafA/YrhL
MSSNARYHSLDSLRGIASMQVVIGHCLVAIPSLAWLVYEQKGTVIHNAKFYIAYSPFHFFWSASPAVLLFFVLSGFVLSLPYYSSKSSLPNYWQFFVKRILRLYLPCFTIIVTSLLLMYFMYKPNQVTMFGDWIKDMWTTKMDTHRVVQLLLLNTYFNDIDSALWTLPIEIKLSLILPLFVYFHKKLNVLWSILSVVIYACLFHLLNHLDVHRFWSDFSTLYYFTFFIAGSLMCKYKTAVIGWIDGLSGLVFFLFFCFAVCIYTYQYSMWWLPAKIIKLMQKPEHYLYAVSGAMFIMVALSHRAKILETNKVFLFLGKYSFSIYLTHQVVVVALAYWLGTYMEPQVVISIAFVTALFFAVVFYKLIEMPALGVGKSVSGYLVSLFSKKDGELKVVK